MDIGVCWRCEQPGHAAAECQRPPAATRAEVEQRILRYMERAIEGRISLASKRKWTKAEWDAFHSTEKEKVK